MDRLRTLAAGPVIAMLMFASMAAADPVTVKSGPAQLPTSGLVIDLPVRPTTTYKVSGSWSLNDATGSFDTRDIVDEFDIASGAIIGGNWVLVGYFTAGGCDSVLNSEKLDNAWTTETALWGESWKVRGGVYTFDGDLGRRPAAVLCRSNAAGKSLILYRYLVNQPENLTQVAIMSDVARAGVLESASKSYNAGRVANIEPLRRPETRKRGTTDAARTTTLTGTGLTVAFPDDGFVWLPEPGENTDYITRMIPSLPEISLEVTTVQDSTCEAFLPQLADARPDVRASNYPSGWQVGPTFDVNGESEMTLCRPFGTGFKLLGIFLPPGQTDVGSLTPVINAISDAY